uniref:Transposon TX1 uncharacterized n=1 Tax=Cajanus cajan TaxID=3821 RepID=A0A151TYY3_CAJCA|nr:Transposon TX1 uncharacterized [Cajanus cajan]
MVGKLDFFYVSFVQQFYENAKLPKGTNSSFISLISKVDNPMQLNDYRPISLVGCMYKLLAKTLARRLKVVLPSLVDEREMAFVEGRGLLQSAVILNETLDEVRRMRKTCIFFKVDFEKAYDSVSWSFLLYMLQRLGFDDCWISWIKECLCSSSMSVLVNESPTKEFNVQKGIRQGDPLAALLLVLIAEGLTEYCNEPVTNVLYHSTCMHSVAEY